MIKKDFIQELLIAPTDEDLKIYKRMGLNEYVSPLGKRYPLADYFNPPKESSINRDFVDSLAADEHPDVQESKSKLPPMADPDQPLTFFADPVPPTGIPDIVDPQGLTGDIKPPGSEDAVRALKQIPKGLARGTETVVGTVGSMARWAAERASIGDIATKHINIPGAGIVAEYLVRKFGPKKPMKFFDERMTKYAKQGEKWADFWEEQANKGWEAPDPEVMQAKWRDMPITKAAATISEAAPNYLVAIASSVLTKSPQTGLLFISALSGGGAYRRQRKAGAGVTKANAIATLTGAWEYVTELVPFKEVFKPSKNVFNKMLKLGTLEATQEFVQGIGENFLEYFGYKAKDLKSVPDAVKEGLEHTMDGWVENVVAGAGLGVMGGGIVPKGGLYDSEKRGRMVRGEREGEELRRPVQVEEEGEAKIETGGILQEQVAKIPPTEVVPVPEKPAEAITKPEAVEVAPEAVISPKWQWAIQMKSGELIKGTAADYLSHADLAVKRGIDLNQIKASGFINEKGELNVMPEIYKKGGGWPTQLTAEYKKRVAEAKPPTVAKAVPAEEELVNVRDFQKYPVELSDPVAKKIADEADKAFRKKDASVFPALRKRAMELFNKTGKNYGLYVTINSLEGELAPETKPTPKAEPTTKSKIIEKLEPTFRQIPEVYPERFDSIIETVRESKNAQEFSDNLTVTLHNTISDASTLPPMMAVRNFYEQAQEALKEAPKVEKPIEEKSGYDMTPEEIRAVEDSGDRRAKAQEYLADISEEWQELEDRLMVLEEEDPYGRQPEARKIQQQLDNMVEDLLAGKVETEAPPTEPEVTDEELSGITKRERRRLIKETATKIEQSDIYQTEVAAMDTMAREVGPGYYYINKGYRGEVEAIIGKRKGPGTKIQRMFTFNPNEKKIVTLQSGEKAEIGPTPWEQAVQEGLGRGKEGVEETWGEMDISDFVQRVVDSYEGYEKIGGVYKTALERAEQSGMPDEQMLAEKQRMLVEGFSDQAINEMITDWAEEYGIDIADIEGEFVNEYGTKLRQIKKMEGEEQDVALEQLATEQIEVEDRQAAEEAAKEVLEANDIKADVEQVEEIGLPEKPEDEIPFERRERPTGAAITQGQKEVILLAFGADSETGYHEGYHLLRRRLTEKDRKILDYNFKVDEEAEARSFAEFVKTGKTSSRLRAIWQKLLNILRKIKSGLQGRGLRTAQDIFGEIRRGVAPKVAPRGVATQYERGVFGQPIHVQLRLPLPERQAAIKRVGQQEVKDRVEKKKQPKGKLYEEWRPKGRVQIKTKLVKAVDAEIARTMKPRSNTIQTTPEEITAKLKRKAEARLFYEEEGKKAVRLSEMFYDTENLLPEVIEAFNQLVKGGPLFQLETRGEKLRREAEKNARIKARKERLAAQAGIKKKKTTKGPRFKIKIRDTTKLLGKEYQEFAQRFRRKEAPLKIPIKDVTPPLSTGIYPELEDVAVLTDEQITKAEMGEIPIEGEYKSQSEAFNKHLDYFQNRQLPKKSKIRVIQAQIRTVNGNRLAGKISAKKANYLIRHLRKQLFTTARDEGIAFRMTRGGKVSLSVRKAGTYVPEEFAQYGKFKNIRPILGGGQDITRAIQQMDGSLSVKGKLREKGQAGPLERHVLWPTRDISLQKLNYIKEKTSELKSIFKTKKGSKEDEQINLVLEQIAKEDRDTPIKDILSRKTLRAIASLKVIQQAIGLREFYDNLIDEQNLAREMRDQDQIPYRHNYSPHILRDTTIWERLMMTGKKPKDIKADLPDYIKPNAPFNPRAMAREAGIPYEERVKSAQGLAESYLVTAAKDIFNTSIVQNNKAFIQQIEAMGYDKSANYLADWTAEAYAGVKPRLDRAISIGRKAEKGARYFNRLRNMAVFPLNFSWSLLTQTSSLALTVGRYGTTNTLRGFVQWLNPKIRKQAAEDYYSYIVKSERQGRITRQDAQNLIGQRVKLRRTKTEIARDISTLLLEQLEKLLTGTSIRAAHLHGQKRGLTGEALRNYASDGGAKTQSMYNDEDKPAFLRNLLVKTGAPYQTFAYEVVNTMREWAGRTGTPPDSKLYTIWTIIRFLAAAAIFAAIGKKYGNKEIWSWKRPPIPFAEFWLNPIIRKISDQWIGSASGLTSPVETAKRVMDGIDDVLEAGSWRKLRNELLKYGPGIFGVPGGIQISRTVDAIIAYAQGGVKDRKGRLLFEMEDPQDLAQAIFSGIWSTEGGRSYLDIDYRLKNMTVKELRQLRRKNTYQKTQYPKSKGIIKGRPHKGSEKLIEKIEHEIEKRETEK